MNLPMFRFTIRDMLWLMALVAVSIGWSPRSFGVLPHEVGRQLKREHVGRLARRILQQDDAHPKRIRHAFEVAVACQFDDCLKGRFGLDVLHVLRAKRRVASRNHLQAINGPRLAAHARRSVATLPIAR